MAPKYVYEHNLTYVVYGGVKCEIYWEMLQSEN